MSSQVTEKTDNPFWQKLKKPGKSAFWVWVGYQAVKGTLTTSLIWIPLIWAWIQHH